MFRTKVTISLLEVALGLLQPLHPVHDLKVNLRLITATLRYSNEGTRRKCRFVTN